MPGERKGASAREPYSAPLTLLPYGEDLLKRLANDIIQRHADRLPDLTHVSVLLPSLQPAPQLRHYLLAMAEQHGHTALLGPEITTLGVWVGRQQGGERPLLSPHQRELMLVEALIGHPYLYGEGNPWTLADSLIELFDEMAARHITLARDLADFTAQLAAAYQLPGRDNPALRGEARLVHTLWTAWHEQLSATQVIDPATAYALRLRTSLDTLPAGQHLYVAGLSALSPAEADWLKTLLDRGQVRVLLQGSMPNAEAPPQHADAVIARLLTALDTPPQRIEPGDDFGHALGSVFAPHGPSLRERAGELRARFPASPVAARVQIFAAGSAEEEAQAVDLQTRRYLLAGHRRIGIITENRRLARRVRALLERAGITLQDAAGWALSTTSAAAVLERWLQTVEEDFAHQPLLDLLKSPFLFPDQDRDRRLAAVYRFEQGIVLKEQIARGLQRYQAHLRYRQARLPAELAADYADIPPLLETLARAAAPLEALLDQRPHPPAAYLAALGKGLEILGLAQSLEADAAGQRVLEELRQMQAAVGGSGLRLTWVEFRAWLGRTLERFNFQPATPAGPVQLMSLAQSPLCRFDALIIAGAEREYLPGGNAGSPFFNDGVRAALGLATSPERLSQRHYLFRRLLESAPHVLITRRREQDGEEIAPSPWVALLQSFHTLAYDDPLQATELAALVGRGETQVTRRDAPLPLPPASHPAPTLPAELLPTTLSASGYQQLIDCPYQFFAARGLGLEPPETIREMLEKSDYGERVHLCLQAFHEDLPGLPGPFTAPLCEDNTAQAIHCLEAIAEAVFARDLEDNFLHRGWLKRWRELIPAYVRWQQGHGRDWQTHTVEAKLSAPLDGTRLSLSGRLDRLDRNPGGFDIIDYKTGAVPKQTDIDAAEAVQLPFYAQLAEAALQEEITRVEYLALDQGEVKTAGCLTGDELADLKRQTTLRLRDIWLALEHGAPLPAWGDDKTCTYCRMAGLCRRQAWEG